MFIFYFADDYKDRENSIIELSELLSSLSPCKCLPIEVCATRNCYYCTAESLYDAGYRKLFRGDSNDS